MKTEQEATDRTERCFNRLQTALRRDGSIPEIGLPLQAIEGFLTRLASLDSNNRFNTVCIGAGEREGRVLSPLVQRLHYGLAHGIGRSGNLTERQPKAIGSSILSEITNKLALDAIRCLGIPSTKAAMVVPVATGMALSLCLGAWRHTKRRAKFVVFLRIDQKSCFKSIFTAGFEPIIIDGIQETMISDGLITDLTALKVVLEKQKDEIIAVLSATSCFAPRQPDDLIAIGELCTKYGVKHLVNNAYGLQSPECRNRIEEAGSAGYIDAFIQSTDKNFLVPVGGSIVATFDEKSLNIIANFYPGRASIVPSRDLLITLLQLGKVGLRDLYNMQQTNFEILRTAMREYAETIGQKVMEVKMNRISLAVTLKGWTNQEQNAFGAQLFSRGVTGARTVPNGLSKTIDGYEFLNFGSHSSRQHDGYLNVACAIGMTTREIEELVKVLKEETPKWAFSPSNNAHAKDSNSALRSSANCITALSTDDMQADESYA
ncbi:O-phosphoseryl-tRNA(Sec) selenium transferase [Loa loa]|uniref:O-phosphoseryl-tRNA(Sec) selenium transferase n=1 Tax=Loa loa TaxID=7209 RepID=A0A1I7VNW1_LOALO|nr:O-phosphoseryl-tRNA(Sec) selenium transferase [Loa loa]EFO26351.1 O-phosphoseryl-tRNA(Sec) selenium transferase [Loa loa]